MTVLVAVIGASGYLGSHVVGALRARGVSVVATARDVASLAHLPDDVQSVSVDMSNPLGVYERLGHPDRILHLAWEGLPNYSSSRHFADELPRQFRFLRQLVIDGASSITIAGTCLEYGLQSGRLCESLTPDPVTAYGFAKFALCRQLQMLAEEAPYHLTWARLFYLFGKGQAKSSLYSLVKSAAARGDHRFDMSAGEQLRDFLPVEVAAGKLAGLVLFPAGAGIVNVCSGTPISVRRLVETWFAEEGATVELNLGRYAYPSYEPMAFWGSADKLAAVLGKA